MGVRLRVPDVDDPDFVADVRLGDVAELRLAGSADTRATAGFHSLLAELHDELVAHAAKEIVLDMYAVDSMIASCFKELVAWVARVQDLAPEQRYRIRLRANPFIAWQQHSLRALSCFDTELLVVES